MNKSCARELRQERRGGRRRSRWSRSAAKQSHTTHSTACTKGRGEIRIVKKWVMMRLFRVISQWRSPKHLFFIFLHLFFSSFFFACSCHWMRDLCDKHTLLLMRTYRISSRSRRTSKRKVVVCRSSSRKMLRSLDELFVESTSEEEKKLGFQNDTRGRGGKK